MDGIILRAAVDTVETSQGVVARQDGSQLYLQEQHQPNDNDQRNQNPRDRARIVRRRRGRRGRRWGRLRLRLRLGARLHGLVVEEISAIAFAATRGDAVALSVREARLRYNMGEW